MQDQQFVLSSEYSSRPARGAWIEMPRSGGSICLAISRAPHGARGLKYNILRDILNGLASRAPHGARGLKYPLAVGLDHRRLVAPRTGRVD